MRIGVKLQVTMTQTEELILVALASVSNFVIFINDPGAGSKCQRIGKELLWFQFSKKGKKIKIKPGTTDQSA